TGLVIARRHLQSPDDTFLLIGGAVLYSHNLSAMMMLKNNHIWACGGRVRGEGEGGMPEGGRGEGGSERGADVVMLDDFPGEERGLRL
ncbi:MAG: hypothetical protein M1830_002396, partial [Pleopsidium flavum]